MNVALPSMQADLRASSGAVQWVVAGYALTSAVFLITAARLGDRIGRRRVFSLGLGLFTLSSTTCGVAANPTVLVVSRLVQGAAAALLMPNVLSIVGVAFSGPDRARAGRLRFGDGLCGNRRAAHRRQSGAGQPRRSRLAQLLLDQRAGGCGRVGARAAAFLGVAITGAIFCGALGGGYAHAFELSLAQLAALLLAVAMLTRRLPAAVKEG